MPQAAHAEVVEPYVHASAVLRTGVADTPPVVLSTAEGPDGDVVVSGTAYDETVIGTTTLVAHSPSGVGFVARMSPDGRRVRWVRGLGGASPFAADVRVVGDKVILATRIEGSGTGLGGVQALAYDSGYARWNAQLGNVQLCAGLDITLDDEGRLVLVGSYTGSLWLQSSNVSASTCSGFVERVDPASGQLLGGAVLGAGARVQQVAAGVEGKLFLAGTYEGTAVLGNRSLTAGEGEARAFVAEALLADGDVDVPWAAEFPITCDCQPDLSELLVTGDRLVLRTSADVVPGAPSDQLDHVAAIAVAGGTPLWQRSFAWMSGSARPLTAGADGTVVGSLVALGPTDLGDGHLFPDEHGFRPVVFALDTDDGSTAAAARLGDNSSAPRALLWDGDEILVSGRFNVPGPAGSVESGVNVARTPVMTHLSLSVLPSSEARSDVGFAVSSPSAEPVFLSVSGPCALDWDGGSVGHVDVQHVGTCAITATQQEPAGSSSSTQRVAVIPVTPDVAWPLPPITYGSTLGPALTARFVDSRGVDLPGAVTFSRSAGEVPPAGHAWITATYASGTSDALDMTVTKSQWVRRAAPSVVWDVPGRVVYGWRVPVATARGVDGSTLAAGVEYDTPPGTLLQAGGYGLTAVVRPFDDNYEPSYQQRWVTVTKALSGFTTDFSASRGAMTAVLRDTSNSTPIARQQVRFEGGAQSCLAFTDSAGRASCPITEVDAVAVMTKGFTAYFAGDFNHESTSRSQAPPV